MRAFSKTRSDFHMEKTVSGSLKKKIHIPFYQDISTHMSQVYTRYIFTQKSNKTDLVNFQSQSNTKHTSIKFE